jgi:hypothetical protein
LHLRRPIAAIKRKCVNNLICGSRWRNYWLRDCKLLLAILVGHGAVA